MTIIDGKKYEVVSPSKLFRVDDQTSLIWRVDGKEYSLDNAIRDGDISTFVCHDSTGAVIPMTEVVDERVDELLELSLSMPQPMRHIFEEAVAESDPGSIEELIEDLSPEVDTSDLSSLPRRGW